MSSSSSAAAAGEEGAAAAPPPQAAPVERCKGANGLEKVVLREVRGSSAEVRSIPHTPTSLSLSVPTCLDVSAVRRRYRSVVPAMLLDVTEQSWLQLLLRSLTHVPLTGSS